jgi:hypothetical protein
MIHIPVILQITQKLTTRLNTTLPRLLLRRNKLRQLLIRSQASVRQVLKRRKLAFEMFMVARVWQARPLQRLQSV